MGGGPCKTQETPKPRSPIPGTPTFQQRHRSPPSQGMPVDTAGKGHPKPEFQNPPALHLEPVGRKWSEQEALWGPLFTKKTSKQDAN